ncbi:MAG TPA: amidohydrolase family protein [Stellaceae bacterium]|nr:amidohydrolase family protein [Stellaceae bacterium]
MDTLDIKYRDPAQQEFDSRTLLKNAERQARQRHYEDIFICDVDAHHYENESFDQIAQFIEDPVIRQTAAAKKGMSAGRPTLMNSQVGFQDVAGRVTRYTLRRLEKSPPSPHRDITLTKRWMDAIGIDVICLFPTPMLNLGLHPQVEAEVAIARAYNRWLCDTILDAEPRLKSMLYLPFNDPEATYKVVKDFGARKGVVGFMVTSARYKPVYDNAYMKTYALLEEMGLPLSFHAAYSWDDRLVGNANRFITVHALGFTVFNMVNLANWIVNGLPERFPKLKVMWIESGLAWIPFMMQRFDNEYMMRSSECPSLKMKPSDYMRQMYFTSQPMEMVGNRTTLEDTFRMMNAETQLCYASDYPHWDMDLPSTIYDLPFLNDHQKRNILGGNAQRFFNIEPVWSDWKVQARAAKQAAAQ